MKLVFEAKDLRAALRTVKGSVPRRATLPVLAGVRIMTSDSGALLTTTDLEHSVTAFCPAVVDGTGGLVVDHKGLSAAVKGSGKTELLLAGAADTLVKVDSAGTTTELAWTELSEYPLTLNAVEANHRIEVSGLSDALKRCFSFVSKEETRHILNGIYLHLKDGVLRVVATDGKRLKVLNLGSGYPVDEVGLIIPTRACKTIIGQNIGSTSISWSAEHAVVKDSGVLVITRLIKGEYVDYQHVLDSIEVDTVVSMDRGAFHDALKQTTWWDNKKNSERRGVVIEPGGDGIVKLTTDTVEQRSETTISGTWSGSARFSLNPYIAYDVLDSMGTDEIQLETIASGNGAVRVVGADDEATILMPRRITCDPPEERGE